MERRSIITFQILWCLVAILAAVTSPLSRASSTALDEIQSRLTAQGERIPSEFDVETLAMFSGLIEDYLRALAPSYSRSDDLPTQQEKRRLFEAHATHWHPLIRTMMIRRLIEKREEWQAAIVRGGRTLRPGSFGRDRALLRGVLVESLPATFREGTRSPSVEVRLEIVTRMSAALEIALAERSVYPEVRRRLREHRPSTDLAAVSGDIAIRIVSDRSLSLVTRHAAFAQLTRVLSMMRTEAAANRLTDLFRTLDQFVEPSELATLEALLIDQIGKFYFGAYHWKVLDGDEVFEFIHHLVLSLESLVVMDRGELQNARYVKALVAILTPKRDLLQRYIEIYHADDPSTVGGVMAHLADVMFDFAEADTLLSQRIRCPKEPQHAPSRDKRTRFASGALGGRGRRGSARTKPRLDKKRAPQRAVPRDRSLEAIRQPLPEQVSELMATLDQTLEEMKEFLPRAEIPPKDEGTIHRAYAYFGLDPEQVESDFGVESADLFFQHVLIVIWHLAPLLDPAEIRARVLMPMGGTSHEEFVRHAQGRSGLPTCEMIAYLSGIHRRTAAR